MAKSLRMIGCANGSGGRYDGCESAAHVVRNSEFLKHANLNYEWLEMINEKVTGRQLKAVPGILDTNERLARSVCTQLLADDDLLVINGDHSSAIGTWSGVAKAKRSMGPIGLIWVDAHLDAHTPETSDTGNVHGMPTAHLLGHGDGRLTGILDKQPKILPKNLAFIGSRSYEPDEVKLLEKLSVRIFYQDECDKRCIAEILNEAIQIASNGTVGFGISIDLDGFRVEDAPAVGTPEKGGIVAEKFIEALEKSDLSKLVAAEIVEFMPHRDDKERRSEKLVVQLIEAIYGRKYGKRLPGSG